METLLVRRAVVDRTESTVGYHLPYDGAGPGPAAAVGDVDVRSFPGRHRYRVSVPALAVGAAAARDSELHALDGGLFSVEVDGALGPTAELLRGCEALRSSGIPLVLADGAAFLDWCCYNQLFDGCSIDFALHPGLGYRKLADNLFAHTAVGSGEPNVAVHNVGTRDDYHIARHSGHRQFEGRFLMEPEEAVVPARKHTALALIQTMQRSDWVPDDVDHVLRTDPGLTHQLLRFVNSAGMGVAHEVRSIKHAVVILGERAFRRWATLAAFSELAAGSAEELLIVGMQRARMSEILAGEASGRLASRGDEAFLSGLLSVVHLFLGVEPAVAVGPLPLAKDVKAALVGYRNDFGLILEAVRAVEDLDWAAIDDASCGLGLVSDTLAGAYVASLQWVGSTLEQQRRALGA